MLAADGADVTFFYRDNAAAAARGRGRAGARGGPVAALQVDIRDSAACAAAVERVADRCGRIDILVNNAGVTRDNPLAAFRTTTSRTVLDDQRHRRLQRHARRGAVHDVAARGTIVNLSSVSGEKGGRGQTNYAASKGAINAFTRALAVELAPRKIRSTRRAGRDRDRDVAAVREQAGDEVKARILLRATARRRKWRMQCGSSLRATRAT